MENLDILSYFIALGLAVGFPELASSLSLTFGNMGTIIIQMAFLLYFIIGILGEINK